MITYNSPIRVSPSGVELYSHGTAEFPCGCYRSTPLTSEVPWHWHEEMEFVHFRENDMLYLAGGERFVGQPGDGVFVNGGVPHSELPIDGVPCVEGSLVCHPKMLYGDRSSALWTRYFRHLFMADAPQVVRFRHDGEAWEREAVALVREAWEAVAEEAEFYEETCRANLTRVCLLVLAHAQPTRTQAESVTLLRIEDRVKDMIRFVEEHYGREVTIRQIAQEGGVGEREAQREFQELVGMRPMEYLANYRLFVASQQLKSTDASIGEVARNCGFPSQSYFTKRFRERYGHTPSQHRKLG
ncbi:MAG: helix-turn-helix domain-containing protein [Atopobiaceae bacterium]|nr:helix-turn-helix domain-containing protein [Atopobiaceae bacterium]